MIIPKLGGYLPESKEKPVTPYKSFDKSKFHFASSKIGDVDLREYSSPRHQQLTTSSCVGQSSIKALEIKRIIKYGHKAHVDLSVLDLYFGARDLMRPKMTHIDSGTYISLACEVLKRFGVCRDKIWPFKKENLFKPPPIMATREAYLNKIFGHYRLTKSGNDLLDDIILNLQSKNPVIFGTQVDENWFNYTSNNEPLGIPEKPLGAHAMVLVGFVNGCFIVENSWGQFWGDNGFAFVRPEVFTHKYTQDAWTILNGSETYFEKVAS